ncbi:inosose dehydratase [Actinocatenispora thailandica]|uniref:Inosose dehydratase n=1 Tax=Actinocatenispora thailandica TaxID=227318 RepID=A0A7R7DQB2_9ACTN|nr:TIM barrel protein [Actinocatenispora thailandica]BCJ35925.1 inosose dehydratase [Actinocatenispora thailandica]
MSSAARIAAAPISWGVCEVPGWGHQLAPQRVLAEMAALGLSATEFGPDGFLPAAPTERAALLAGYGMVAVGGFVPVALHTDGAVDRVLSHFPAFRATAADTLVLAAASGTDGYDDRPELSAEQWRTLLSNLDEIAARATDAGLVATLHPHVGTLVENGAEVERVLDGSRVGLCLDTGHLLVGGVDPVALSRSAADRIGHVHLKDVDAALAAAVRAGTVPYSTAVRDGLYRPLGAGDVDVPAIVAALGDYPGWYVLEQDVVLSGEPAPGAGPAVDVAASLARLRAVLS